jgi:hypothetical protein
MKGNLAYRATVDGYQLLEDTNLRVVIAYDDLPAYRQALRALVSLIPNRYCGGVDVSPRLWRFDDLAEPGLKALAVEDGASAAVVVVSMSAEGPLPTPVQAWLPACLGQRRDPVSAVVVLVGDPGGSAAPESQRHQFVRQMARMADWEFVAVAATAGRGQEEPLGE